MISVFIVFIVLSAIPPSHLTSFGVVSSDLPLEARSARRSFCCRLMSTSSPLSSSSTAVKANWGFLRKVSLWLGHPPAVLPCQ